MDDLTCPTCGAPECLTLKWNSGHPMSFWLSSCTCKEEAMEAEIERRVQRWINGACCERCWIDRNSHNEAGQLLVRQPAQMHSAGLRYCHFCGAATVMGILVRVPEGGS